MKGGKKMKKIIEDILDDVQKWTTEDGGLTITACDLLDFGRQVIEKIQANDVAWLWELDPFDTDTGHEEEIVLLALQWAKRKLRRRIEDRLRKDDHFFEQVAELHLR
jgi:hypothetical protein